MKPREKTVKQINSMLNEVLTIDQEGKICEFVKSFQRVKCLEFSSTHTLLVCWIDFTVTSTEGLRAAIMNHDLPREFQIR